MLYRSHYMHFHRLALELLHHSRRKLPASPDFPRSKIIQSLSHLVSSIDFHRSPNQWKLCHLRPSQEDAPSDTWYSSIARTQLG